jgi:hypothetical protein
MPCLFFMKEICSLFSKRYRKYNWTTSLISVVSWLPGCLSGETVCLAELLMQASVRPRPGKHFPRPLTLDGKVCNEPVTTCRRRREDTHGARDCERATLERASSSSGPHNPELGSSESVTLFARSKPSSPFPTLLGWDTAPLPLTDWGDAPRRRSEQSRGQPRRRSHWRGLGRAD